jgi:hypothetical protein
VYKSPLHILSDLNADSTQVSDPDYLLRLRKKLLAEFNLTNSATIDINGKPYSKDEVIKTIDVLLGNPLMPLHSFIFSNKPLLDFLENDTSKVRVNELQFIPIPEELKPMLSPILLERISLNIKKAFHARNFDGATELLTYMPRLQEEEVMKLNEEVNRNIENMREHVQSVRIAGCKNILKDLDYLKKNSLAVLLNRLPPEFIDSVNSLVGEIINTMVSYQKIKGHDRAYLYYVSNNLTKIKCDEELMKLIKSNHQVFTQNYEGRSSGSYSSGGGKTGDISAGRVIYIVLIVVVFIIRVATCSSRHSSSGSKYYNDYSLPSSLYSSMNKQETEKEEFESYRKHLKSMDTYGSIYSRSNNTLAVDSSISGDNPFRHILKNSSSRYDYEDTSLRRVLIKNTSGQDLIVVAYDSYNAKAYYFFDDKPDTLSFHEGDKLCFYFGTGLSALESNTSSESLSYLLKPMYEVYFKEVPKLAYKILGKDYTITFKQKIKKPKKKKKKTPVPIIVLDRNFFSNDSFENEKVKLSEDNPVYDESVAPMEGEVTVTPQ